MPESFLATNIKALFNHATEFFCIINSNLVYEYVNPSHIRLFSGRDLTGLSIEAAQPELKNTEFVPTLRKILQTGETVQYEEIAVQIGTEVRYLNMLYAPRRNYSGVVDGIYALGSDITEKVFALKQVRQALKEADLARNDLHELFMQAPFPICFLSGPDYVFTMVNPEYMKYIQRQVEGKTLDEVYAGQDIDIYRKAIDHAYHTGEPYLLKGTPFLLVDDEGNQRETYLNAGYQPFKNSSGEVRGVLIIFIDVTDQVKSLMARDNFISIASHELKTPLTTLKLQTQMIKRSLNKSSETQSPQIMSFFDKTEIQLDRLDRLVNDMLEGSRKSEEKLEMHFVRVDFSSFVREIFQNYDPQFKNVGIDLVLDIQEGISAQIDEARLEQVLVNLITNMIRYAPHAPAKVMMTTDSQNIRLEVSDGGMGVDLEDQEVIFERFGRGSSQKDTTGLGLGLYISRKIVEAHSGVLKVKSRPGQGATFVITLPT